MTKRGTRLITVFVAIIMATVFLLTCFSVFGAFLKSEKKVSAVDISVNNKMTENIYNSYSEFVIKDKEGLLSLYSLSKTKNFLYKKVCLGANMDLGWKKRGDQNDNIGYIFQLDFAGEFDGCGYTISNAYYHSEKGGFFCYTLKGTVKNVKFTNIMHFAEYNFTNSLSVIAYEIASNGNVNTVIISDCAFMSNYDAHCASFAYKNLGTITNCLVDGIIQYGGHETLLGDYDCHFFPFVKTDSGSISNCIYAASEVNKKSGSYNGNSDDYKWETSVTNYFYAEYHGNYSSYAGAKGKIGSCSSVAGPLEEVGSAWYQQDEYNDGDHVLRYFETWKKIEFTASEGGSVDKDYLWYPYGGLLLTKEDGKIIVNGQTVTATPVDANAYEFDFNYTNAWRTVKINAKYQAMFKLRTFTITFNAISEGCSIEPSQTEMSVTYGATITKEEDVKNGIYTYVITDVNNNGRVKKVYYTLTNKAYIFEFKVESGFVVCNNISIRPTVKLKSYNITFG